MKTKLNNWAHRYLAEIVVVILILVAIDIGVSVYNFRDRNDYEVQAKAEREQQTEVLTNVEKEAQRKAEMHAKRLKEKLDSINRK